MSASRDAVFTSIRASLGRGRLDDAARRAIDQRLANPKANVVPARGQLQGEALIGLFISEAERVNVTLVRVDGYAAVPAAVAAFLREANLPAQLKLAPDPLIATIPWASEPLLTCITGAAAAEDTAAVSAAFAGVAETGTLVMVSGPDNPTGLNFLPEAHIVVLPTACIVGCYEDAFAWLRASTKPGEMPRVLNWITGPSRTADIEQTLLLGAHGPKRLLAMLVDGEPRPAHA
ncbi:MAG: LUD domain-containing protein [Rhodospirillales bacterium]